MRLPILILLLALGGCSRAEHSAAPPPSPAPAADSSSLRPVEEQPPATVLLPGNRVEVPRLVLTGRPVVEVRIHGRGPYRFAIETGARILGITPHVVAELGLPRVGGDDEEPYVLVDTLTIGRATFGRITAVQFAFADTAIDGILGLNVYADLLITIDPGRHVVRFERDSLPPIDGREVLALKPLGSLVGTDVTIYGKWFVACVDTRGAGHLTMMPALVIGMPFEGGGLRPAGTVRGAAVPKTLNEAGRLAGDLRIGAYTAKRPVVFVHATPSNFPQVPILGSELLNEFTLSLDQRHGRVRFHRDDPVVPPGPDPKYAPGTYP